MEASKIKEILNLLENKQSVREIAKKFGVSHMTIQRLKTKHGIETSAPNLGRPRKIDDRTARHLAKLVINNNPITPAEAIKKLNIDASVWTVRRSLKRIGAKAAVKKNKPFLSAKNIKLRKEFAQTYANWTEADWSRVIWSDETKINRFESDGRDWYWSKDPKTFTPRGVTQTVKHGGGCIMVWGCITSNGVGPLVKIEGTMKKEQYLSILQNNLPAAIEKTGLAAENVVFQHDNDPKHSAKIVKNWLDTQPFHTMKWPAQSPDMNPIENFWSHIKSQLARCPEAPTGVNDLWERVKGIWEAIPNEMVERYCNSMPQRIEALKKASGYWTKY